MIPLITRYIYQYVKSTDKVLPEAIDLKRGKVARWKNEEVDPESQGRFWPIKRKMAGPIFTLFTVARDTVENSERERERERKQPPAPYTPFES